MLCPKKTRYAKSMRRLRQFQRGINEQNLIYGDFGIVAEEGFWMKDCQIEALRLTTIRMIKTVKDGSMICRVFPHKPISKKPLEVRLGRGKGELSYWAATVKKGTILFEYKNINSLEVRENIIKAFKCKLPIKTKVVFKI